jgi:Rho-binding antiterminator
MPKYIKCELHDYIEMVCLFSYELQVKLMTGDEIIGFAVTTVMAKDKEEYLVLKRESPTNTNKQLLLNNISSITVLTENARFQFVNFNDS